MSLKNKLIEWSKKENKITLNWTEIQDIFGKEDYNLLVKDIEVLIKEGFLKSVGTKKNGRKPSLYEKYKIILEKEDFSKYITEIDYTLNPIFKKNYYRKNIKNYIEHRPYILKLNKYLNECKYLLDTKISVNERSFEIFKEEKFMKKSMFYTMIKNLGLNEEFFNYYITNEPIAYYTANKNTPQNILIVENRDTFYTIRKYMKEVSTNIMGLNISTVIYGAGKSKIPSLKEFKYYTEDYISNEDNTFYYFGDIDYEGIVIFDSYSSKNAQNMVLNPFTTAYEYIVDKMIDDIDLLPQTKDNQNTNIKEVFFETFDELYKERILNVLEQRKYIPQEALNYGDLINYNKRRK